MNLPLKDNEVSAVARADEMTQIYGALVALRKGDASAKLPLNGSGGFGKVAEVFNDLVEQNVAMAEELAKLSQMVGTTRPRISLFMQRFRNLGLLETNREHFLVVNEKKLTDYLNQRAAADTYALGHDSFRNRSSSYKSIVPPSMS